MLLRMIGTRRKSEKKKKMKNSNYNNRRLWKYVMCNGDVITSPTYIIISYW